MGRALILCNRPSFLYSLVGMTTTWINIYTAQGGHWSVTAKVTVIVVGLHLLITSLQTLVYDWLLEKIKVPQDKEKDQDTP